MFEEQLEDALCVFKSGGDDFVNKNKDSILFYVDLENEAVIEEEKEKETSEEDEMQ